MREKVPWKNRQALACVPTLIQEDDEKELPARPQQAKGRDIRGWYVETLSEARTLLEGFCNIFSLFLTHFKLQDSQGIVAPAVGATDQHAVFKDIHLTQGQRWAMSGNTGRELRQPVGLTGHSGSRHWPVTLRRGRLGFY